jgi:asparagine synthase (glutamine-hydrolysing)
VSAIFGMLSVDDAPVGERAVAGMRAAMATWGLDGSRVWRADGIALGHLHLQNTPESVHEQLPLLDGAGVRVLTATARLDNRAELLSRLGPWESAPTAVPDSTLILRAYERWGEACADRLLGDWAFALWEPRERKLFLARDHHGVSSLYWFRGPRWFAFASALRGLLAAPEVPRTVDERFLARAMVGHLAESDLTIYEHVHCLPPAHTLTVTRDATRLHRYWRLEDAPDVRLPSDDAYVDACRALYDDAVRARLRATGSIGVTLSGGLDSGSVATLAAHQLHLEGQPLAAFSSVPRYDASDLVGRELADETGLIEATSAACGIEVTYCRAEHRSPLAGVRRMLDLLASPIFQAAQAYWLLDVLEAAQARGVTALLTGQGGNASISWRGERRDSFRALLRAREWRASGAELVLHARSFGVRSRLRAFAHGVASKATRDRRSGPETWADWSVINPQWAEELGLGPRLAESAGGELASRTSREQRLELLAPGRDTVGASWAEMGGAHGVEPRDPTWDKRLLELCLGLPEDQYLRGGESRRLIRRVMAGRMPEQVLRNGRRGRQAADIGPRVLASRAEVDEALAQLRGSALARRCLHLPRLTAVWAALQDELTRTTNDQAGRILLPGLSIGLFLSGVEEHRGGASTG